MEKKRFYKVIRALKHNGEIREFPFTLPYTFDEAYALAVDSTDYSVWDLLAVVPVASPAPRLAKYIVTFEDCTDALLYSYHIVAENGIKAIDAAIHDFKHDFHHGYIDVVGLVRCK